MRHGSGGRVFRGGGRTPPGSGVVCTRTPAFFYRSNARECGWHSKGGPAVWSVECEIFILGAQAICKSLHLAYRRLCVFGPCKRAWQSSVANRQSPIAECLSFEITDGQCVICMMHYVINYKCKTSSVIYFKKIGYKIHLIIHPAFGKCAASHNGFSKSACSHTHIQKT